ncbi:MAG: 8-amino-7-oxononanoate synthase [Acidobacteriota bacterium]
MSVEKRLDFLTDELAQLERLSQRRYLKTLAVLPDQQIEYQGRKLVNFSGNDYLGLSQHQEVKDAAAAAIGSHGTSATSSRLVCGSLEPHEELEKVLAEFKGREAALVFSSGYLTNLGLIASLAGPDDVLFSDALNHASIIDACRLSRAPVRVYRHNDLDHLGTLIRDTVTQGRRFILSDAVFSMDGDLADLPGLYDLSVRHGCVLILDEAHSTGVLGQRGRGLAEHYRDLGDRREFEAELVIEMGTLSKALGSLGGFVCGPRVLRDYLINKARTFIFSTGLPPSAVAAALASLKRVMDQPELVATLRRNVTHFATCLQKFGWPMKPPHVSAIVPVILGEPEKTLAVSRALEERGFFVPAIRPPSVPPGTSRLRIAMSAGHSLHQIDSLSAALGDLLGSGPLAPTAGTDRRSTG